MTVNKKLNCYKQQINDTKKISIYSTPFTVTEVENESTPRSKNQKSVNHCRNTVKYNGDDFCQYIDKSISTL